LSLLDGRIEKKIIVVIKIQERRLIQMMLYGESDKL